MALGMALNKTEQEEEEKEIEDNLLVFTSPGEGSKDLKFLSSV